MRENRARLQTRKQDIFEALRVLEQDHVEGLVEDDAYTAARERYEHEAAEVLESLDMLGDQEAPAQKPREPGRHRALRFPTGGWLTAVALIGVCVVGALALVGAVHQRAPGETITGSVSQKGPSGSSQSSADIQAAEREVYRHPRNYDALVTLGTAYLENGRLPEADMSFQAAMHLDSRRAEAPTFHAMLLGAIKQYGQALALLKKVERVHPEYARAWLMDGVLSSHTRTGRSRAMSAWLRFLLLAPDSDLAPKVRRWIAQLEKAKR